MPILSTVIGSINDALATSIFDCIGVNGKYYKLAEQVQRDVSGTLQVWPQVIDSNGDGNGGYVTPDDQYDAIIYHRALGIQRLDGISKGFGDSPADTKAVWSLTMPVWYKKSIGIEPADLALYLIANFPANYKTTFAELNNKELSFKINVNSVIQSSQAVFREEYPSGVDYFIKTEHSLMAIKYNIESQFKTDCFNLTCQEV